MSYQATTEIVSRHNPHLVRELIALQQNAFPPQMQFQEPERYYEEALKDPRNINVVLRSPHGALLGYLLALPQNTVCEELRQWDPEMREDETSMYLDIVQTYPESRKYSGFIRLLSGVCQEARRRGYERFSLHVRTSYGLNNTIRKLFPDSRSLRRIENWYTSGETFEFIEASPVLCQSCG
jgi:hypothetical protein